MKNKGLIMFIAPLCALTIFTACGTDDDMDPVEEETPLNQEEDNRDSNNNNRDDQNREQNNPEYEEEQDNDMEDQDNHIKQ